MSDKKVVEGLMMVKVAQLETSEIALRGVDTECVEYQLIRDSIAERVSAGKGPLLNSILVKPTESGYMVTDGLQRYTACKELGVETIPALIDDMSDDEMAVAQIITNSRRVQTKPMEFTRAIVKIYSKKPNMTFAELCKMLSCEEAWLQKRIGLLNLKPEIQALVNDGKLGLTNACMLSKLPEDEQDNFLSAAQTEKAAEFTPEVKKRLNDIQKEKRGQKVSEFVAEPACRKMNEIKDLYNDMSVLPSIIGDVKKPLDAAKALVLWLVQMDDASIEVKKAKYEQLVKEKEERKALAKKKSEDAKRAKAKALLKDVDKG